MTTPAFDDDYPGDPDPLLDDPAIRDAVTQKTARAMFPSDSSVLSKSRRGEVGVRGDRTPHTPSPTPPSSEASEGNIALIGVLVSRWENRELVRRKYGKLTGPDGVGFDEADLFRLTREVKVIGAAGPHTWRQVLAAACGRLGLNIDDVDPAVVENWDRAGVEFEDTALASAMSKADREPVPFVPLPKALHYYANYHRVAALVYWLGKLSARKREFCPVPVVPIAAWLNVSRKTAGRIIRALDAAGVIMLRKNCEGKPHHDPDTGTAREARYTGPRPRSQ